MADVDVTITCEQLRYRVPGGIGTYIRGLQRGFALIGDCGLTVDWHEGRFPVPLQSRLWNAGIGKIRGTKLVHTTSFRLPPRVKPLIVTVYDLLWREFPATYPKHGIAWHDAALKKTLERATEIVVPSQRTLNALVNEGAKPNNIHLIAPGIDHLTVPDAAAVDALLRKNDINGQFLLTVGTLEPRKNLAAIVEAVDRANESLSEPLQLLIVGPQGWEQSLPSSPHATFIGEVAPEVLTGLYDRASMLIYAPLAEGFGFPPLEAMSVGTPVIASSVPSVNDVAYLVDPNDVDDIAKAIYMVSTDDDTRAKLSQDGLVYAAKFRWQSTAQQHVVLWTKVLGL